MLDHSASCLQRIQKEANAIWIVIDVFEGDVQSSGKKISGHRGAGKFQDQHSNPFLVVMA